LVAKNKVVDGSYLGKSVIYSSRQVSIITGNDEIIDLNDKTIKVYEALELGTENNASDEFMLDVAGGALLGFIGIIFGLFANKKRAFVISLDFNDGNKSKIEVNYKIYKKLTRLLS